MTPEPPAHLDPRDAALAMLADGNSVDAVAHLLGLPAETVEAWARGGRVAAPEAAAPRPARPPLPPQPVPLWNFGFVVWLAAMIGGVALLGPDVVLQAWNARNGSPPIEQLERIEGNVVGWYDCTDGRHGQPSRVTLDTVAGRRVVNLPCHLRMSLGGRVPHPITILRWPRTDRTIVYQVELDGRKLLDYDSVRRAEDDGHRTWVGLACLFGWAAFCAFMMWMDRTARVAGARGRMGTRA